MNFKNLQTAPKALAPKRLRAKTSWRKTTLTPQRLEVEKLSPKSLSGKTFWHHDRPAPKLPCQTCPLSIKKWQSTYCGMFKRYWQCWCMEQDEDLKCIGLWRKRFISTTTAKWSLRSLSFNSCMMIPWIDALQAFSFTLKIYFFLSASY